MHSVAINKIEYNFSNLFFFGAHLAYTEMHSVYLFGVVSNVPIHLVAYFFNEI